MSGTTGSRRMAAALAAAALTAGLAACAPSTDGGSGDGAKDGTTSLNVWSWRVEDQKAYDEIFAEYEKKHPKVDVVFKPFKATEYNTILATGLQGEGGPDVAQLRSYGGLQPLVEAGNLVPLDDKVPALKDFDAPILEGAKGKQDGKVYGVPFAVQTLQVFYNKKVFADAGVEVPTTWDGLLAASRTLQGKGVTPIATTGKDAWMLPIVTDVFGSAHYGGKDFQAALKDGSARFTDPAFVGAVQKVKDLQPFFPKDVAGVGYTDAQTLFTSGKAAMFPGGSFEYGLFTAQAPDLEIGTFAVPVPPGSAATTPVTPGWADGSFGISKQSKHQKEAAELVSWMATPEFGRLLSDKLKLISAVPGVETSDPVVKEMATRYETSPAPYLLLVDYRYGQPTGTDLLGTGVQKMLLGRATPQQVAADLDKGVSQWFKPSS